MTRTPSRLISTAIPEVSESVFHYTDAGGLLGLVQGRCLRASEASGMNDLAEVRQGWEAISAYLATLPNTQEVDLLADFAREPLKAQHEVFVVCASIDGDDANQWRLYASAAQGYALELDPSVDVGVVSGVDAKTPSGSARGAWGFAKEMTSVGPWLRVIYSQAELERSLDELVDNFTSDAASIEAMTADDDAKVDMYEGLRDEAYEALSTIAHLVKAPGFAGEREARVVATLVLGQDHIHFRPGAYGIVGYVDLAAVPAGHAGFKVLPKPSSASPLEPLPLISIRLGPMARPEQVESVKALLKKNGLGGVPVTRSDLPLR